MANKRLMLRNALLAGGMLAASAVAAQERMVRMTTVKEVGSPITLLVNQNMRGVIVDWGDGNPVTYAQEGESPLVRIEGTVKGSHLSVQGYGDWFMLNCENCGLTELDLSGATGLHSLYCSGNELTSLDLRNMKYLVDLDCSNNQLATLVFTDSNNPDQDLSSIESMNLSNNAFTDRYYYKLPTLQYLNISGNQIEKFYVYDENLRSLDCSNNRISVSLNLSKCTKLQTLNCQGNEIPTLTFANKGAMAEQVICDGNQIKSIDLSSGENLVDISCTDNGLTDLNISGSAKLSSMNVGGNSLTFSVLPTKLNAPTWLSFEPQAPFDISEVDGMQMKDGVPYAELAPSWADKGTTAIDLRDFCSLAGGRLDANYQWFTVDENGEATEMTRRTTSSGTGDYYVTNGKFSFFTPQKRAYAQLTSKTYGFVVQSQPIAIGDDVTGIGTTLADNGLQVSVDGGQLQLSSAQPVQATVVSLEGKVVWKNTVSGSVSLSLPKGVYIVNGQKVIL